MRYAPLLSALLIATPLNASSTASSAYFCRGKFGGEISGIAVRLMDQGKLQFGISKWQNDGQNFGVFGVAKSTGSHWIFEEKNEAGDAIDCRITLEWRGHFEIEARVDKKASCDAHAGYGFGEKSATYGSKDYQGSVTTQLDDPAQFLLDCKTKISKANG